MPASPANETDPDMSTITPPGHDVVANPDGHLDADELSAGRRRCGIALTVLATLGTGVWWVWRISEFHWHPVALVVFLAEIVGLVCAITVAAALARAPSPRTVYLVGDGARDSYWYAHVVADLVGRTRSADLHRDVRTAVRAAPRWRPRNSGDAAIAAVLADGPRRLVLVVAIGLGLLFGITPFGVPPWWALLSLLVASACFGAAHVALGRGRLRLGDRTRWSFGAIGEVIERADPDRHAPRRWRGALAVTVGLSMAVALRGASDRWTHGLEPMGHDDRLVAMGIATLFVLGALYTLQTSVRPDTGQLPVVIRHLDERTARQSLLAVAVCVGAIGLIAGAATPDADDRNVTIPATTVVDLPASGSVEHQEGGD
jgi:hypothetical protein